MRRSLGRWHVRFRPDIDLGATFEAYTDRRHGHVWRWTYDAGIEESYYVVQVWPRTAITMLEKQLGLPLTYRERPEVRPDAAERPRPDDAEVERLTTAAAVGDVVAQVKLWQLGSTPVATAVQLEVGRIYHVGLDLARYERPAGDSFHFFRRPDGGQSRVGEARLLPSTPFEHRIKAINAPDEAIERAFAALKGMTQEQPPQM
jgi:hypothetical protein